MSEVLFDISVLFLGSNLLAFHLLARLNNIHQAGWYALSINGQWTKVYHAELTNLERLQRQIYISRLRFNFSPQATLEEFGEAFDQGELSLQSWLTDRLQKLYIEVRSDSCPPKNGGWEKRVFYYLF